MPPCSLCHGPRAVSKNILAEMAEARKYVLGLYVVPQCKLNGIGVEIVLPLQVRFIVFSHVMVHYGDRNNKRNVTLLVCLYNLEHLGLFIGCQVFLEIAKAVQENVRVLLAGGLKPRCCHEKPRIRGVEFVRRVCLCIGNQAAKHGVMFRAVGQDEQFQVRVEIDHVPDTAAFLEEVLPPHVYEYGIDEILPKGRILKPSIVNHGDQWISPDEGSGEDACSAPARHALLRVDLDTFQS